MKQVATAFVLCLAWLAGCTVTQPLPTVVPNAQILPTTTSIPPIPISPTADIPTPTNTAIIVTWVPTDTPTPMPTATPKPTQRPPRSPDTLDPSLPPLMGQIFMFWDPNPPEYVDNQLAKPLDYNFYRFTSIITPTLDIIDAASVYIPYSMNVSPDQSKIGILVLDDTNGNGKIDRSGYEQDYQTIYIYDVVNNTLSPFVTGEYSIHFTTWFPDSQALLYPQGHDIFLARLDGSSPEPFVNFPDAHINNITLSPNGHSLVAYGHDSRIRVYDLNMNKVVALADDMQFRSMKRTLWSSDGSLLAFGQHGMYSSRPLSLFNTETLEFTVSVALDEEDIVSIPSWSSDGQWLAFTTNQTMLYFWNRDSLAVTEILTSTYISPPIWSPVDNHVAVGLIEENAGKLLVIDTITGNTQERAISSDIQEIRMLSWSPDGNWVAFIAIGSDGSGLYFAPKQGERVYLMLDMIGGDLVGDFVWLPTP